MSAEPKIGVIDGFIDGYWRVRFGERALDVYALRTQDFIGVKPYLNTRVLLKYDRGSDYGLWRAYPIEEIDE